jgi:hypothetical protein
VAIGSRDDPVHVSFDDDHAARSQGL